MACTYMYANTHLNACILYSISDYAQINVLAIAEVRELDSY